MINAILTASGIPYKQTRFAKPPAGTYAVYSDSKSTNGPDTFPGMLITHSLTVALYSKQIDTAAEDALEAAIESHGLSYTKTAAEWDPSEQIYETNYDFEYTEKRRAKA